MRFCVFIFMRVHVIVVGHEIFADAEKNRNTDHAEKCLIWTKMFNDHLTCSGEHQDFDNSLCGMLAEHFYKLYTDYQGQ